MYAMYNRKLSKHCREYSVNSIAGPRRKCNLARNTDALICDPHAEQGFTIDMTLSPTANDFIETAVQSPGGQVVRRVTEFDQDL